MAVVEQPPLPGEDNLVNPDHAPAPAAELQSATPNFTNDLSKNMTNGVLDNTSNELTSNLSHDLSNTEISTRKSGGHSEPTSPGKPDELSNVKQSIIVPSETKRCTNCAKLNAKAHCAGCHQAPNMDGTPRTDVRYCSKQCQKTHWSAHRIECKNLQARKALFRAAWLLQKIWYAVRRESFDNCVVKAEEVDGELLIHEGDYSLEPTKRDLGFYREFPDAIFKDKQDADTCLNLLYCTDSLSHMYMVSSWLLKGICADIKEINVKVVRAARNARYTGHEWNRDWLHEVLRVCLQSGEIYAVDLTGAQYGWFEPITDWERFSLHCTETIRVAPLGFEGQDQLGSTAQSLLVSAFLQPWDNRTDLQRAIPMFNECLKREFNKSFVGQIVSKYPRGSDILKLSGPAFVIVQNVILSEIQQITNDAAEKVDALLDVIISEARICNKAMRNEPNVGTGEILKYGLTKLAALFNGEWSRDGVTGRLNSVSLKRFMEDECYAEKYMDGVLPEQKLWGDLTLAKIAARDMASKEGSSTPSRERPSTITTPSAPTSNGNGHLEVDDMPSSPIHPIQEDLMALARLGELRSIQKLFDTGKASATSADPQGITALHWAAINGHYALCHYLIEAGANVNAKGGDAEATPVLWASKRCHLDVVNLLLRQGADPLLTDDQGYNLLHSATLDGNVFQLILLLHQADVPVDIADSQGHTSLMWAAYKGFPACLDVLLKWGADVHARDELGFTALHWALVKGSYNCIQKLVEYGADRFIANNEGKTPAVTAKDMNSTRQWHRALADTGFDPEGNPRNFPLTFVKDSKKFLDRFFFCWPFVVIGITLHHKSY
ncbi:Palmitoyltransferase akr1, ankyrin repeat-containing protein akr1 [Aureobasidium subglaciale]|nr:Palmitoyltransferase akr1, ankyrin repeat-containing protein akr1 [Aureobasidium subglaciale]